MIIVSLAMVMYLVVLGFVYSLVLDYLGNAYNAEVGAAISAFLWPFTLPVALGMYLARSPERWRRAARAEADREMAAVRAAERRTRELEEDCEIGKLAPTTRLPAPSLASLRTGYRDVLPFDVRNSHE